VKFSAPGTLLHRSKLAVALAAIVLLGGMLLINPAARADLTEGKDYALVPQKGTAQKSSQKVEVLEFFSYGCPHCAAMHPHITKWSESLPGNVEFVRVPVAFGRREWGMLSRTFYTLQNLGELKRLDGAVFDAIHQERQPMSDEASITAWAVKQGINADRFKSEFNSDRVNKAVTNAENLTRDMVVDGVPKIIVAKRYKVVAEDAKSYEDIFSVADRIIDKAAKEK
jgi:protein dithiol oxidoreductase (disulfide-forming)